jgi:hypothetical protein
MHLRLGFRRAAVTGVLAACLIAPAAARMAAPAAARGGGVATAGAPAAPGAADLWIVPGRGAPDAGVRAARQGTTGGARRLVEVAQQQLDATALVARGEVPQGGPDRPELFWNALGAMQQALEELDGALAARDVHFPAALAAAARQGQALDEAWRRSAGSGAAAPDTGRRLAALAATMGQLSGAYGSEALRAQRGGRLSAAEQAQLQRMAQAARLWQGQLAAVAAAARRQQDAALLVVLARLDAQLRQIAAAQATLAGLLAAQQASEQALGLWAASAPFVGAAEAPAWQEAEAGATDLTTAEDTGFVFTADLGSGTAWSYVEGTGAAAVAPVTDGADGVNGAAGIVQGEDTGEMAAGPGETPAGEPAASADAVAGELGAAPTTASDAGWIVVHGGAGGAEPAGGRDEPAAAGLLGELPATTGSPAFLAQLDDLPEGEIITAGEPAAVAGAAAGADAGAEADAGAAETLPPWRRELLCRPWQPSPPPAGVCPLSRAVPEPL